ncbi:MAG: hypothetical protein ACYS0H_08040 [Planctomycetota bacterium]
MPQDKEREGQTARTARRSTRIWIVSAVVPILVIMCCLVWKAVLLDSRSIDEKLAAIDAELAIPDSENAAVRYRRFWSDPCNVGILHELSDQTRSAYRKPWTDDEHPELAAALDKHGAFLQAVQDISNMPRARFPAYPEPGTESYLMLAYLRRVTVVLSWAAANDLAEGRFDAAYGKYRCQLQLVRHFEQQPWVDYRIVGTAIKSVALRNIRTAVMRDGTTSEQMRLLEAILEAPRDQEEVDGRIAARVNRLGRDKYRSKLSTVARLKWLLFGHKSFREGQRRVRLLCLRLEATQRATPILIALRRYKGQTGAWPETLEQIEPKLPAQMLTDPQNDGPFVYKRDGKSFILYSKGPNGLDEQGSSSSPADDWPIWP